MGLYSNEIGIYGWFEYLNKNEPALKGMLTQPESAYVGKNKDQEKKLRLLEEKYNQFKRNTRRIQK